MFASQTEKLGQTEHSLTTHSRTHTLPRPLIMYSLCTPAKLARLKINHSFSDSLKEIVMCNFFLSYFKHTQNIIVLLNFAQPDP